MKKYITLIILLSGCGQPEIISPDYEVFVEETPSVVESPQPVVTPTPEPTTSPSPVPSPTTPPIVCKKIIYTKNKVICVKK